VTVTNTPPYYNEELIPTIKSFIVQALGDKMDRFLRNVEYKILS
jgi:hypothetical protein